MSEAFATLVSRTRAWFEQAHADGWLSDGDLERFGSIEKRTPADLFADAHARPLVVAFFGGTGVGKSSLLNRLAGQMIARTGVERPTSREVTIYVHEAVELATLPPELPVEQVRIERHSAAGRRDVLWIDAPDIDSAHEHNRELALAWLPHVDLLVYVVSPERYRDDVGWRILLERGQRHGWMFVLNRWDEGDASQKDDFARMLYAAGFNDPLLLSTCCLEFAPPLPSPDEFDRIEGAVGALLGEHGVRELERLGQRARLLELRDALRASRQRCGDDEQWKRVAASWERHWQRGRAALLQGMEWPIRAAAGRLATRRFHRLEAGATRVLGHAVKAVAAGRIGTSGTSPGAKPARAEGRGPDVETRDHAESLDVTLLTQTLWDDWTQDKLVECLDAVEVEVRRVGLGVRPVRTRLDAVAEQGGDVVLQSVRDRLRTALARPGTLLQRALRRVTGFLMAALPLVALLWVAHNVVVGYYRASTGAGDYLGVDFAVSSVLLIVVAWAVPFVCDRLLRPSLERAALRGMRQGLAEGLDRLEGQMGVAIAETVRQAQASRQEANALFNEISGLVLKPVEATKVSLSRLLVTPSRSSAAASR